MNVEPTCRYCQRKLVHRGTRGNLASNGINLCYCHYCESEQTFDDNASPIEYSFMVGKKYCIHFWPKSKAFKIVEYNEHGRPQKYVLELTLNEPPNYMTPQNMTEERVKTLIVFS